jgi:hypothetical protein
MTAEVTSPQRDSLPIGTGPVAMEVGMGGGEHHVMHLPSGQARTIGLFRLSIPASRIVAIGFISLE